MNIQINGSELLLALTGAGKVVPRKNSIPVLGCVRFTVEDNRVKLTATDLDATMDYTFEEAEVVNRSGSVIVNVKDLQRLVKKAAKDSVRLIDVKPDQAEITLSGELGERTHYLPAYPEDEWQEPVPNIPVRDADGRFLETLRQVQPFASTDETRYVLNGAAIQQHEGSHLLVTTDGHRLCASQPLSLPLERDLIVPPHKFALWTKLSPDCALGADGRYFRLVSGPWSLTVKQIEGEFPRWRQILPRHEDPKTFTLHPDDLPAFEEAVRTLPGQQSVIPTDGDTLLFLEQDGKLTLECTNVETGKHQRTLPRSRADAEVWIPLQRGYVLQAVKAGFTTWRMQDSLCPIQSDTEDGAIHVLMPMRYEGEAKFPAPGKARQEDQPDPAETPNPQPEPQKEDAMSMNPPEYDPTDAEGQPPDNTVPFPVPEPRQEPESLEDLLVMVQDTRAQVRDLNKSLGDIASFIRSQKKQDKQLRSELSNARGVLEKLRDIAA